MGGGAQATHYSLKQTKTLENMENITLTNKELELIGTQLEMIVSNRLRRGCKPQDFKTLKALRDKLNKAV